MPIWKIHFLGVLLAEVHSLSQVLGPGVTITQSWPANVDTMSLYFRVNINVRQQVLTRLGTDIQYTSRLEVRVLLRKPVGVRPGHAAGIGLAV